jgi:hypothetical protein
MKVTVEIWKISLAFGALGYNTIARYGPDANMTL